LSDAIFPNVDNETFKGIGDWPNTSGEDKTRPSAHTQEVHMNGVEEQKASGK
jgi:hypothetical protein